jgi:hypothetical protein
LLSGSSADAASKIRVRPFPAETWYIGTSAFPSCNAFIIEILNSVEERNRGSAINLPESMVKISR